MSQPRTRTFCTLLLGNNFLTPFQTCTSKQPSKEQTHSYNQQSHFGKQVGCGVQLCCLFPLGIKSWASIIMITLENVRSGPLNYFYIYVCVCVQLEFIFQSIKSSFSSTPITENRQRRVWSWLCQVSIIRKNLQGQTKTTFNLTKGKKNTS